MKQVININFQGRVIPIEVSAFETLKSYIDSLRRYFSNEDGREEIINDIESRIAELFQERLKAAGSTCITDDDVSAIIASIGRPEDFEETTAASSTQESQQTNEQQKTTADTAPGHTGHKRLYRDENNKILGGVCAGLANYFGIDTVVIRVIFVVLFFTFGFGIIPYIILWVAVPSTATTVIGGSRKKFFRDPDNKIIAGVCSGIGNYFGINAWIPRILFLLPFISIIFRWGHWGFYDFPSFINFSFSPGSVIVYIILWLVIQEASTTTEKLEMKGEKVDMNSIKNSVVEEMKGVGDRVKKFGEEASDVVKEKGAAVASEISKTAKRSRSGLGDLIAIIVKGVVYFIMAAVCFGLVVGLFALGIFSIGIFPLKDYLINDGWQNVLAWGTLIFFIAVPIIGVITWVIRRIAKMRGNSKQLRWSFSLMWVLGWICFISLLTSVSSDFRSINHDKMEEVYLSNPKVNKLEITSSEMQKFYRRRGFRLEPFEDFEPGDTLFVNNVDIYLMRSPNDSFRVTMQKYANGAKADYADSTARLMDYNIVQQDSLLRLPKGIPITTHNKFRNQNIFLTVYVPVGKVIRVNGNTDWNNNVNFDGPFIRHNRWDWGPDWDLYEHGWHRNRDYRMTDKGLVDVIDGQLVDQDKYPRKVKKNRVNNRDDNGDDSRDDNGDDNGDEGYCYDNNRNQVPLNRADSLKMIRDKEIQRTNDSLDKIMEDARKMKEKLNNGKPNASINNSILPISGPQFTTI